MVRIGTGGRVGPAQIRPARAVPEATESAPQAGTRPQQDAARALVVIDGGQSEEAGGTAAAERSTAGKPRAGFVAQLLTAGDPTLLPSRLERTRMAAACYTETARRLA
ncbi:MULTISPECIES: hypothetical protein [Methylobacterium]|jgi:hypothetical protein|uniref:Uncharacterized protein n=1 Tax=Methylobacterium longum TaxID=767694 RepID=A0ABT8AHU5_9HYPH|nr:MULTISPECIES: hypothetical protein [Methylobacterium]MCJ2100080.1 hypothetical protein [Methylobacterium sp. E-046]MDN3569402.1 hypothetical protein [Methylobacterium longum]GJE12301.1 hypothetical protein FOHLNKBM_3348 [Methylobacterium longum]